MITIKKYKIGVTVLAFELYALKSKIKGVLAGHIVAMLTFCAKTLTVTCSLMIGQFFDTVIWASIGIEWL